MEGILKNFSRAVVRQNFMIVGGVFPDEFAESSFADFFALNFDAQLVTVNGEEKIFNQRADEFRVPIISTVEAVNKNVGADLRALKNFSGAGIFSMGMFPRVN